MNTLKKAVWFLGFILCFCMAGVCFYIFKGSYIIDLELAFYSFVLFFAFLISGTFCLLKSFGFFHEK